MELKAGGKAAFDYGWGVTSTGTIVDLIPNEKMSIKDEQGDLMIWTLSAENNGTRVTIEYTGLWLGDQGHSIMDNMAFGTYQFLKNMKSVVEEDIDNRIHSGAVGWVSGIPPLEMIIKYSSAI